jgi:hypothetical protein
MWTTLSLWLFVQKKPMCGGIALGLAWLTKGIFSGLFPIIVIALFLIYDILRFRSFRLLFPFGIFTLTPFLIYSPWHVLELTRFKRLIDASYFATFDQGTFGSWNWMEVVDRFSLRYLVFLWTFLRWWFPIAIITISWSAWRLTRTVDSHHSHRINDRLPIEFFPIAAFLVVFLTLSAARDKNDWYLMPIFPFLALMISDFAHHVFQQKKSFLIVAVLSISNLLSHWHQAFPPNSHLVEKHVAEFVNAHTSPDDLIVTAEYEFPTLRYYSEREVRTAARQSDFQGKYWWIWDNADIEVALRQGERIVTVTRPGAEWPVDVWGYHRERIGEVGERTISRVVKH